MMANNDEKPDRTGLNQARIARFERYRATLPPEEQQDLDWMVESVAEIFRDRCVGQFGKAMAKEFLMDICIFMDLHRPDNQDGGAK